MDENQKNQKVFRAPKISKIFERELIANELSRIIKLKPEAVIPLLEKPKYSNLGDISFPCFHLSKQLKKNPYDIAIELKEKLQILPLEIEKVDALGGYLNFFLNKKTFIISTVNKILKQKDKYGSKKQNKKKIVIDFSSPNIAKPMSIGHLRSTIIGNSLYKIHSFLGYKCIAINFLGDYGTQFGKLLVAYKKWNPSKAEFEKDPINTLLKLYNKFHVEAESNLKLEDEARKEFKKLEEGDKENIVLWKKFRALSIKEFEKFYSILGVKFDLYSGESFYRKDAAQIITEMRRRNIAVESQNALIVNLEKYNLPPLLIRKSDGATMYSTRDIAAAAARYNTYKFEKMLYVVASEQNTYFKQLFKTLEILGMKWAKDCRHVNFGMIYMEKGKISTRKGEIIFLEDVIEKIINLSREMIADRKLSEAEKSKIAKAVGVSALIYSDLSNDRIKDIKFDWDRILRLDGDSGPYLQYTYARANSILTKIKAKPKNLSKKDLDINLAEEEKELALLLNEFPLIVENAASSFSPHVIANYVRKVADTFNTFYEKCPVLKAENERNVRLALTAATAQVIKNSLLLLGMIPLEKM